MHENNSSLTILEKKQYQNFWAKELLLPHVAIITKAYTGPI